MNIAPPLELTTRFRHFSCPECQGSLEQVKEPTTGTLSYLCRIGHRYDPREMLVGKEIAIDRVLWAALTAIDELVCILKELKERGDPATGAPDYRARCQVAIVQRGLLEQVIAANEPVRLEGDFPIEVDPKASIRQRQG